MSKNFIELLKKYKEHFEASYFMAFIEKISFGYNLFFLVSWIGLAISRNFSGLNTIELYLPLLTFAFVMWFVSGWTVRSSIHGNPSLILYFTFLIISVSVFYLNQHRIASLSIWYDEVAQGLDSLNSWPVEACSRSSQPPYDCFWQKLFQSLLGQSVLGLRLGTLAWYSLSVSFLSLLCFAVSRNIFVSVAAVSGFVLNPSVHHYAIEARPVSLSLFTGCLFLGYLVLFLQEFKIDRRREINLAILYCQFVLSIGMQPVFLGFSVFLSLVIGAIPVSSIRLYLKKSAKAIAVGLVVSLPIQVFTIYVQRTSTFGGTKFDFYKMIFEAIQHFEINRLKLLFWPSGLVVVVAAVAAVALLISIRKTPNSGSAKASLIFSQASIIFLLTFPILFSILLPNNYFQIRYLITGFVFIWISFAFLASKFENKKFVSLVSVILILDLFISGYRTHFPDKNILSRQNLSEVYDWISKNTTEQDLMVSTCIYQDASEICYATRAGMLESNYYSTKGKAKVQSGPSPFSRLSDVILKEQAFGKLFLVFETQSSMSFNASINRLKEQKLVPILNVGETLVAVFDGEPEKFRAQWFGFFDFVQTITPPQNCTAMEVKLQQYLFEKKHSEFVTLKADWFKKCIESPVLFQTPYYNDLEQRVWGAEK